MFTDDFYEVQLGGMDVISSEVCGHVVTFNIAHKSQIQKKIKAEFFFKEKLKIKVK